MNVGGLVGSAHDHLADEQTPRDVGGTLEWTIWLVPRATNRRALVTSRIVHSHTLSDRGGLHGAVASSSIGFATSEPALTRLQRS